MSAEPTKKKPKRTPQPKKKPQATRKAQAGEKRSADAVPKSPSAEIKRAVEATPEVVPRLDVPLHAYDERAGGVDLRPVAFRVVPWVMLAVVVVVVVGALRGVMTAPVSPNLAKPARATPTTSAVYRKYTSKAKFRIKVTTAKLNLRAQPAVYSALLSPIPRGTVLLVMKKKGDWYRIVAPSGNRGWVNANPAYSKRVKK